MWFIGVVGVMIYLLIGCVLSGVAQRYGYEEYDVALIVVWPLVITGMAIVGTVEILLRISYFIAAIGKEKPISIPWE